MKIVLQTILLTSSYTPIERPNQCSFYGPTDWTIDWTINWTIDWTIDKSLVTKEIKTLMPHLQRFLPSFVPPRPCRRKTVHKLSSVVATDILPNQETSERPPKVTAEAPSNLHVKLPYHHVIQVDSAQQLPKSVTERLTTRHP
ncbi:hypothetical protein BDV59DRAFT_177841 [Aspergillus ambiguus]|uniref:uncharacterized protein n=1 Tax=Aspergillus ambiguus TaxID=176160 RepID=UPI003CCD0739